MKDPKQILESFRTDVQSRNLYSSLLRQFDLEYPNSRGNRRKPKKLARKNMNQMAAALSVCLVTGLSAGVGSAFANNDFGSGSHPLDEPPSQTDQKIKEPQSEEKELERDLLDRPAELEKKVETPEFEKDHQPNEKEFPSMKEIPEDTGKVIFRSELQKPEQKEARSTDERAGMENAPAEEQPQEPNLQEKPGQSAQPEPRQQEKMNQTVEQKETPIENQTDSDITKAKESDGERKYSPKYVNTENKTTSDTDSVKKDAAKAVEQKQPQKENIPQTEQGGVLPDTAGNDLNGVLLGSVVSLLGSVYVLRKNKVESS